ncbi:MAG: hypothetical protein NVV74_06870 [Magnetospirillum sp.]|nr:hypothetical protein [Magnetospirillum sp.]
MKATVAAAAFGLCVWAAPAFAEQGILTCQITLGQFAEDVYTSKARLTPAQMDAARDLVEVGRSQCRSGSDLVMTDIQSARQAWDLDTGRRVGSQFSSFWPASPSELALLTE